jgi:molecular chaperone DnaK
MRVLAVDFGASNTVAMIRTPDGRTRLLPSALYFHADGRVFTGLDAALRVSTGNRQPRRHGNSSVSLSAPPFGSAAGTV